MEGEVTAVLQLGQGSAEGFPSPLHEQQSHSALCPRDFWLLVSLFELQR